MSKSKVLAKKKVRKVSEQLGFNMNEAIIGSVDEVYKLYYDVTNDDINFNLPEIKFTDAPPKSQVNFAKTHSSQLKLPPILKTINKASLT